MKKTLITLALVATAASGSAMAWTASGTGGNVELGGSLNPFDGETPWEVKVGDAMTALDAQVQKGQTKVDIKVNNPIPVLGIRTKEKNAFAGNSGYCPQINFGDAFEIEDFIKGEFTLTLPVKGMDDAKIGTMTAPFAVAGIMSFKSSGTGGATGMYAADVGDGFFGGLPLASYNLDPIGKIKIALGLMPDIANNFDKQGYELSGMDKVSFKYPSTFYSGFYASGIETGQTINISLDSPASADVPVRWKASMPVTVTYI
ncbi:fimbrial protein [Erwinia amylovora]|uniref:F4 family fimbrial subunit n=1 Tax=Erwinia amylovora TaxID=552 RepID=UPI0012BC8C14|nr:fimbrial protein [Erwinia amylovora]